MNKIILRDLFCQQSEIPTSEKSCLGDGVDQSVKCEICDFTFKSKTILKMHIRSVHEGKKETL